MLSISKLTDYGVALTTRMASDEPAKAHTVRTLAEATAIPPATVGKLCKLLAKGGVFRSQRGAHGGYRLSRPPSQISLAAVITAVEGRIGITECARDDRACEYESRCEVRSHWRRISADIERALDGISLAAMAQSRPASIALALGNVRQGRRSER